MKKSIELPICHRDFLCWGSFRGEDIEGGY